MSGKYLIVGAGSGVGLFIVRELLKEGCGVVALNRSEGEVASLAGLEFHQLDVTDRRSSLPKIDGPVSGLVYLPGTINLKPFKSLSEEDYQRDWEVNCLGAVRTIKAYLPNLEEGESSSVVLFSTVAVCQGIPFHASISAAKGGVEGLTRSLAAEFAPKIRVNAIAPSLTNSPLSTHLLNEEKKRDHAAKRHPMHRFGEPEDIGEAALFLLKEKSRWITGQVVHVDGGLSTLNLL